MDQVPGKQQEVRQVFDLPKPKIKVTEHQLEIKRCPSCNVISKGSFPQDVRSPVQYGNRVKALAVYFSHQHFVPTERLCQIFDDIFNVKLSAGTCSNVDSKLFAQLEPFEVNLKTYLIASKVLHFDETGMRCNKKLHWIHTATSEDATFYGMHKKRGKEALDELNILPNFNGTAVHDHWMPYFSYQDVMHSLCNAHHLRELTFVHENEKEEWALEMKTFLLKSKREVENSTHIGYLIDEKQKALKKEYGKIILKSFAYHLSLPSLPKNNEGL